MVKIHKDGSFDIVFLEAIESNDTIKVKIETPFGIESVVVSSSKKYVTVSGIPKWKQEVINLIKNKYKNNFVNTKSPVNDLLEDDEETSFTSQNG